MKPASPGQSISEYILGAGLIAVVSIGVLVAFADQLEALLPETIDSIFNGADNTTGGQALDYRGEKKPASDDQTSKTYTVHTVSSPQSVPGSGTVMLQLDNGLVITMDNFPLDMKQSVETTGANGTTDILLAHLDGLIQKLSDNGQLTDEETNLFQKLANQGHRIAEMERLVEDAVADATAQGLSNRQLQEMQVEFEGKSYSVTHLLSEIAFGGNKTENSKWATPEGMGRDPLNPQILTMRDGGEMRTFIETYHQLEKQGVMQDPALQTLVKELSGEIVYLAEALEHPVHASEVSPNDLPDAAISELTHYQSEGICNVGGGNDTGVHCP